MPILNKKKISSKLKLHFKNLPPKGGGQLNPKQAEKGNYKLEGRNQWNGKQKNREK